jgi:hypothetical protein
VPAADIGLPNIDPLKNQTLNVQDAPQPDMPMAGLQLSLDGKGNTSENAGVTG